MFPCLRRTPEEGTNRNNNLQLEQTPDPDMRGQNRGSDIDRGRRGKQEEGQERGGGFTYRGFTYRPEVSPSSEEQSPPPDSRVKTSTTDEAMRM